MTTLGKSWPPDGRYVAFASDTGDGGNSVMVFPTTNGQPRTQYDFIRLTYSPYTSDRPRRSPDSNCLLFDLMLGSETTKAALFAMPFDPHGRPAQHNRLVDHEGFTGYSGAP